MNPTQQACKHVRKRGNFCADCGARIDVEPDKPTTPARQPYRDDSDEGWLAYAIVLGVFAVIAAVIILLS
jgi:hypothetical protein